MTYHVARASPDLHHVVTVEQISGGASIATLPTLRAFYFAVGGEMDRDISQSVQDQRIQTTIQEIQTLVLQRLATLREEGDNGFEVEDQIAFCQDIQQCLNRLRQLSGELPSEA